MSNVYDFIIIGAGPSALKLYQYLKSINKEILILEKSRNIGGRIAHRRFQGFKFELGANSFIAFNKNLKELAHQGVNNGGLYSHGQEYFPYKCLNDWTRSLVSSNNILNQKRVIKIITLDNIQILCDDGSVYYTKNTIITAPAHQCFELLKNSGLILNELNNVNYSKEIYYFTRNDSRLSIPELDEDFSVYKNGYYYQKWSFKNWNDESREDLKEKHNKKYHPLESHCHKWRYSKVTKPLNKRYQIHFKDKNIYLAGDYFFGNDIQAAVDSADYLKFFI